MNSNSSKSSSSSLLLSTFYIVVVFYCYCCCSFSLAIPFIDTKLSYVNTTLKYAPAPIIKLNVIEKNYVDLVIGNPGKYHRLGLDFSCGSETVILFQSPEDNSRTFSVRPPTILVYFGAIVIRLPFAIEPYRYDSHLKVPYSGYLCMGYKSALWDYWSKATVSPYQLVLGEFDQTLARISFEPFELLFKYQEYLDVVANETVYQLYYDLESDFTILPRKIYHDITSIELEINHLHFEIDNDDIKIKLITGFDRTLIRKSLHINDTTITLGRQFSHNFVHYINYVTRETVVLPSFDQFNFNDTEPLYTTFASSLFVGLGVVWLGVIFVRKELPTHKFKARKHMNINSKIIDTRPIAPAVNKNFIPDTSSGTNKSLVAAYLFSMLEICAYISAILILMVDTYAYAYYRHLNFILKTSSNALYVMLNTYIIINSVIGLVAVYVTFNTYRYLRMRRLFFETTVFLMIWLMFTHSTNTRLVYISCLIISAIYVTLRLLHFFMHSVFSNSITALCCFIYSVIAVLFYEFYNLVPITQHFFFSFDDHWLSNINIFLATVGLPTLIVIIRIPLSIFTNTSIDLFENQLKIKKTT